MSGYQSHRLAVAHTPHEYGSPRNCGEIARIRECSSCPTAWITLLLTWPDTRPPLP